MIIIYRHLNNSSTLCEIPVCILTNIIYTFSLFTKIQLKNPSALLTVHSRIPPHPVPSLPESYPV